MSSLRTRLDAAQVLQEVYDSATESLRTSGAPPVGGSGTLTIEEFWQ